MSNIQGLLVANKAAAKQFCEEVDPWALRVERANQFMSDSSAPKLPELEAYFWEGIAMLDPTMLASLLVLIRDGEESDHPYGNLEKILEEEMPLIFGSDESDGPWLWQMPDEIVSFLSEKETENKLPNLAMSWKNRDTTISDWELEYVEALLASMKKAADEARRIKELVFVYVCT